MRVLLRERSSEPAVREQSQEDVNFADSARFVLRLEQAFEPSLRLQKTKSVTKNDLRVRRWMLREVF